MEAPDKMYLLRRLEVINMYDWVESAIAVSNSKERLIAYHRNVIHHDLLIDVSSGDSLEKYVARLNSTKKLKDNRRLSVCCFDLYYTIEEIEVV